nr:hypothetical protein [Tanacetum cinerariifolium]
VACGIRTDGQAGADLRLRGREEPAIGRLLSDQQRPQRLGLVGGTGQLRDGGGLRGAFGPQAIRVATETVTAPESVCLVDKAEHPRPVGGRVCDGNQGPDLCIQTGALMFGGAAIGQGADQEPPLVREPLTVDEITGNLRLRGAVLTGLDTVQRAPGGGQIDVVLSGFPALTHRVGRIPVEAANETRRCLTVIGVALGPQQDFFRRQQITLFFGLTERFQQSQHRPGLIAGGAADLIGVLIPGVAFLAPVTGQQNRTLLLDRTRRVGVAQATVLVIGIVVGGVDKGIGNALSGLWFAAAEQRDASERVVIREGHAAQGDD